VDNPLAAHPFGDRRILQHVDILFILDPTNASVFGMFLDLTIRMTVAAPGFSGQAHASLLTASAIAGSRFAPGPPWPYGR